jgi:sugar phosphate permease
MTGLVVYAWNYVFDHEVSPLRHIPDIGTRHMILQMLGWMWAVAFSLAIGHYAVLGISLFGHAFLIAAAAITVATYTAASTSQAMFPRRICSLHGGEHE